MTRFLVVTSPARGHLYPLVETLLALAQRGHECHVVTLDSEVAMLTGLGLSASPLPAALNDAEMRDWQATSPHRRAGAVVEQMMARVPGQLEHTARLITEHRPDAVLVDLTVGGGHIAAQASGLPWAMWSPTYLPLFSPHGPVMGLGLRPREGRFYRIRDAVLARAGRAVWDRSTLPTINRARASAGLPALRHGEQIVTDAPLVLNYIAEPLEFARPDWPSCVHLMGPSLWTPPAAPDPRIAAIDRPIALVTCSTEFQDDGQLAEAALRGLAATGLHTVVTTGALDPAGFTRHDNASVMAIGPHEQILDKTAVVISHGGMGITHKALARGIPMVIVPFGRDQFDVANRVAHSGAGVRLDTKSLGPEAMHAAVLTALGRRPAARAVAARMDIDGIGERSATLIEELVAGWS